MITIPNNIPIKGIIQVGANDGGELDFFTKHTSNILLFEPVESARNTLIQRINNYPNTNITISDYVVSNTSGPIDFFIAVESGNSSLFDLNPERPAFNQERCKHDCKVTMNSITLDNFFQNNNTLSISDYNYLFMDVQGAEHLVLEGATKSLEYIDYIWMEVSYCEIYLNTLLFNDMTQYCDSLGYALHTHIPSSHDPSQGDVLYIKKSIM